MLFPQPMRRGVLIRRYKRFLADVMWDDGSETTVHVPNPGAMLGLNTPGMGVWCSDSDSKTRKLPLTWELVEADGGLVGVNTMNPNRIVAEALAASAIPELTGYTRVRPEVKYGEASRIDFLLQADGRPDCWLEVKNCHFMRTPGLAEFPDCVAARSAKHLRELEAMVARGERAVQLFVVQRADAWLFNTAGDIDKTYHQALRHAAESGVEVLVYACRLDVRSVSLDRRLSWSGVGWTPPSASLFGEAWNRFHAGSQPAGHLLRSGGNENWVRFHSLLGSKQFAQTNAERAAIIRRMNILAAAVLGDDQPCWMIQNDVNLPPDHPAAGIYHTQAEAFGLTFQGSYHPWDMDDENELDVAWGIYAGLHRWRSGAFDATLIKVADEDLSFCLWMSAETGAVFAPYPGGADILLPTPGDVASLKTKFSEWLPTESDRL